MMSFFFSGANSLGEPVFMRFSEAMVKEWFTPKGDGNLTALTPKASLWRLRNGSPRKGTETAVVLQRSAPQDGLEMDFLVRGRKRNYHVMGKCFPLSKENAVV